ncbi:MAG: M28 family peptidase [Caldilineales bacterium]|nr:M28 family peptidase [Caldilineales bacterium]MDW8319037.1 M28 family peptidase [Anaerolineae bacterium]
MKLVDLITRVRGWLRAYWLELALLAVLAVAVWWLVRTGRELLAAPTVEVGTAPGGPVVVGPERVVVAPPGGQAVVTPATVVVTPPEAGLRFDADQAFSFVTMQTALGPRPAGSNAAGNLVSLIGQNLEAWGWQVEVQTFQHQGLTLRNVIARAGSGPEIVLLATHYDTRLRADRDPDADRRSTPVTGAVGSAGGVAVLLALAQSLTSQNLGRQVWLAFLDGGDNADLEGWPAAVGAGHLAESLRGAAQLPQAAVVINVIGAADQRFRYDPNSDPALSAQLWALAAAQGSGPWFLPEPGEALIDDHLPLRAVGIPAAAIVDTAYPLRYTTADVASQVDVESLARVGRLLEAFVKRPLVP